MDVLTCLYASLSFLSSINSKYTACFCLSSYRGEGTTNTDDASKDFGEEHLKELDASAQVSELDETLLF